VVLCDEHLQLLAGFRCFLNTLCDQAVDAGEEIVRQQRLHAKDDVHAGILLFCFFKSADDEYRKLRVQLAELTDKLRAGHAGHEVVCDDELDGGGKVVCDELFERTNRVEHGDDEISSAFKDGLPSCSLNGVVVNKEYRVQSGSVRSLGISDLEQINFPSNGLSKCNSRCSLLMWRCPCTLKHLAACKYLSDGRRRDVWTHIRKASTLCASADRSCLTGFVLAQRHLDSLKEDA